jgi:hypothetical protein
MDQPTYMGHQDTSIYCICRNRSLFHLCGSRMEGFSLASTVCTVSGASLAAVKSFKHFWCDQYMVEQTLEAQKNRNRHRAQLGGTYFQINTSTQLTWIEVYLNGSLTHTRHKLSARRLFNSRSKSFALRSYAAYSDGSRFLWFVLMTIRTTLFADLNLDADNGCATCGRRLSRA